MIYNIFFSKKNIQFCKQRDTLQTCQANNEAKADKIAFIHGYIFLCTFFAKKYIISL